MTQEEKLHALKSEEAELQQKLLLLDPLHPTFQIRTDSLAEVQRQIQELESA